MSWRSPSDYPAGEAFNDATRYRGAAAICGTTHKTVKRIIDAHEAASDPSPAV
jgi:hypothetical protein